MSAASTVSEERPRGARDWIAVAVFAATAAASYARLYFGVDLTDDAYYAALPWAFHLGHRPVLDEWAIHQLAALPLLPAVSAWARLTGSSDGLVLFLRHLHFVAALGVAGLVWGWLRARFDHRIAWLCSAVVVAYVPFHMPALSYNTITSLALTGGLVLLARAATAPRPVARQACGTLLLGLASFSYPPMAVASGVAVIASLHIARARLDGPRFLRVVAATAGPMVAWACIAGTGFALIGGLASLEGPMALNDALGTQGGGAAKVRQLMDEVSRTGPFFVGLLVWLNLLLFVTLRAATVPALTFGTVLLGTLPLFMQGLSPPINEPHTTAPFYWMALGLASPLFWRGARDDADAGAAVDLRIVVLPSIVAGLAIAWATANGLRNTPLGLLPAAVAGLAGIASTIASKPDMGPVTRRAAMFVVAALVAFQLLQYWHVTYRNGRVDALTETVASGPWAGIRTTPQRAALVHQLAADIERVRANAATLLSIDYLPAGYLLSDLRPLTSALWTFPDFCCQGTPEVRRVYARRFEGGGERPDVIVDNHCLFIEDTVGSLHRPRELPPDPLRETLREAAYDVVARHPCYTLLRATNEPAR